eukprot:gnl/MRDRNA2_/MRDRNA2_16146_c0_seq1.p1 gnl/MRDRNA2_/MRDRNA2_16146_c0~~gnl/MRDRNA2_/MRDRNA2_16146_c0_seq1.p1  ORF type:complete len:471 (+),score=58.54 gnl/MRDRNA2_/MRDRNA2_16146_c0_seq1:134-1546(+)
MSAVSKFLFPMSVVTVSTLSILYMLVPSPFTRERTEASQKKTSMQTLNSKTSVESLNQKPSVPEVQQSLKVVDIVDGKTHCKLIGQPVNDKWLQKNGMFFKESYSAVNLTGMWRQCVSFKRSCALVGSSANLLSENLGEQIDKLHDVVIRVNGAPSGRENASLAKHVGFRTDVRIVNSHGMRPEEEFEDPMCLFIHEPYVPEICHGSLNSKRQVCQFAFKDCDFAKCCPNCTGRHLRCRASYGGSDTTNGRWGNNHVFLDLLSGELANSLFYSWFGGQGVRTGGLVALSYALRTCDQLSVYGFGPDCEGNVGARYYDYGAEIWKTTHGYNAEMAMLTRMSIQGIPKIPPSWTFTKHHIRTRNFSLNMPKCLQNLSLGRTQSLKQVHGPPKVHRFAEPAWPPKSPKLVEPAAPRSQKRSYNEMHKEELKKLAISVGISQRDSRGALKTREQYIQELQARDKRKAHKTYGPR